MPRKATRALSRQERALSWRRDYVLDCAERTFARKGFYQATMEEIAQAAEYATGTLYTLFESKDAIFAAVVRRRLPELDAHLRAAAEGGASAREKIERLVRAFFEFFEEQKHLLQIYVNVTGGFLWNLKAELGEEVSRSHLSLLAFLEDIFRDGLQRREVDAGLEPRVMAVSLSGILVAVATDWITQAPDRSLESGRDATLDLVARIFRPPDEVTVRQPAPARRRVRATNARAKK